MSLNRPTVICASLIGAVLLACSFQLAWLSTSDRDEGVVVLMLALPTLIILGIVSMVYTGEALLKGQAKFGRVLAVYVGIGLVTYGVYGVTEACLVPSGIRLEFSYPGNTVSYQRLRVYFLQGKEWMEGPELEGWPMRVTFPDLNYDGHFDLRVTSIYQKGTVEFIYLVKSDGRRFWHEVRDDSDLSVSYPPDGVAAKWP